MDSASPKPDAAPEAAEPTAAAPGPDLESDSLESVPEETSAAGGSSTDASKPGSGGASEPPPKKPGGIKSILKKFNVYLLAFVFILVIAGVIIAISFFQSQKTTKNTTIKAQSLTQSTLDQISNSDATVGDPKQVLNIESNAVFAGKVLVRDSLEVAGGIQVSGDVGLEGITVTGDSSLQQAEIGKNLSVGGNLAVQGQTTIAQGLQVNSTGTFSGALSAPQVTTSNLQLNSDLVLTHHIVAGGPSPGKSSGGALGNGGTTTVGGSDTAGQISVNVGGSPAAGCFITVNFSSKYASSPYVNVTPVGAAAGGLSYYITVTTTGFSLCDAGVPPAGSSFAFDYLVVD